MALSFGPEKVAAYILETEHISHGFDFLEADTLVGSIPRTHPEHAVALRRGDLARLRMAVGQPYGLPFSTDANPAWQRLIIHCMVFKGREGRLHATRYGIDVCRQNTSCRDGTEKSRHRAK